MKKLSLNEKNELVRKTVAMHGEVKIILDAESKDILQQYIENNFTLDAPAKMLVSNILSFVANNTYNNNMADLSMLTFLLDGIGITEKEIIMVLIKHKL